MFSEYFATACSRYAGNVCIIDARDDRAYSYDDVRVATDSAAAFLLSHAGNNPRFVATLPNSTQTLFLAFGALKAGLDFAPISPDSPIGEIVRYLSAIRPGTVLCLSSQEQVVRSAIAQACADIQVVVIEETLDWLPNWQLETLKEANGRLLVTSSGTTGAPKTMVFSGKSLWESAEAFARFHSFLGESSRFLNILPMSLLGGIYNVGMVPLSVGASVLIGDAISSRTVMTMPSQIVRHQVDVLWLVPTLIRAYIRLWESASGERLAFPKGQISASFLGTAPISAEEKNRFEALAGFPLLENYALSETLFISSETLCDSRPRQSEGIGQILPYVQVHVGSQGNSEGLAQGGITVNTPHLYEGTLAQDSSLVEPALEDDGSFSTGDFGLLSKSGHLRITGRAQDVIKKGGVLIALREIEIVAEGNSAIDEVAAVAADDAFYGQTYSLFVHPVSGTTLTPEKIVTWLKTQVSPQRLPDKIHICGKLPRTLNGKVIKHVLTAE